MWCPIISAASSPTSDARCSTGGDRARRVKRMRLQLLVSMYFEKYRKGLGKRSQMSHWKREHLPACKSSFRNIKQLTMVVVQALSLCWAVMHIIMHTMTTWKYRDISRHALGRRSDHHSQRGESHLQRSRSVHATARAQGQLNFP